MKQIKSYLCDNRTPTDEEIMQCVEIANAEDCIVELTWYFSYSECKLNISKDMTFEKCKNAVSKRCVL